MARVQYRLAREPVPGAAREKGSREYAPRSRRASHPWLRAELLLTLPQRQQSLLLGDAQQRRPSRPSAGSGDVKKTSRRSVRRAVISRAENAAQNEKLSPCPKA